MVCCFQRALHTHTQSSTPYPYGSYSNYICAPWTIHPKMLGEAVFPSLCLYSITLPQSRTPSGSLWATAVTPTCSYSGPTLPAQAYLCCICPGSIPYPSLPHVVCIFQTLLLTVFWLGSAKGMALQEVRWGLKGKANACVSLLSTLCSNSNRSISLPRLYLLKSSHRSFLLLGIALGSQQGDATFEKNNSKWIYLQRDYLQRYRYRGTWRRKWKPTPVLLPGESHGQRSLAGYSPWGHKELDTTEQLNDRGTTGLSA